MAAGVQGTACCTPTGLAVPPARPSFWAGLPPPSFFSAQGIAPLQTRRLRPFPFHRVACCPLVGSLLLPPMVQCVPPLARYGGEHKAPELQKEAVYGLTELHREAVK